MSTNAPRSPRDWTFIEAWRLRRPQTGQHREGRSVGDLQLGRHLPALPSFESPVPRPPLRPHQLPVFPFAKTPPSHSADPPAGSLRWGLERPATLRQIGYVLQKATSFHSRGHPTRKPQVALSDCTLGRTCAETGPKERVVHQATYCRMRAQLIDRGTTLT